MFLPISVDSVIVFLGAVPCPCIFSGVVDVVPVVQKMNQNGDSKITLAADSTRKY